MHTHTHTKDSKQWNQVKKSEWRGTQRDIPVCTAEHVCFGRREGRQASAAVPEEQLVSRL